MKLFLQLNSIKGWWKNLDDYRSKLKEGPWSLHIYRHRELVMRKQLWCRMFVPTILLFVFDPGKHAIFWRLTSSSFDCGARKCEWLVPPESRSLSYQRICYTDWLLMGSTWLLQRGKCIFSTDGIGLGTVPQAIINKRSHIRPTCIDPSRSFFYSYWLLGTLLSKILLALRCMEHVPSIATQIFLFDKGPSLV